MRPLIAHDDDAKASGGITDIGQKRWLRGWEHLVSTYEAGTCRGLIHPGQIALGQLCA